MKIRNYSVSEVFEHAIVNLTLDFYCSKHDGFIAEEVSQILDRSVTLSGDPTHLPTWTNSILLKEYDAKRSKYRLKIGPQEYNDMGPRLRFLLMWVNENATADDFSGVQAAVDYDHRYLRTAKTVSNIDTGKLLLKVNEKFLYEKFPTAVNNPRSLSIKRLSPLGGGFVNSSAVIHKLSNVFKLPVNEFYAVDFTNHHAGILKYNYIKGHDYAERPDDVLKVLEYYVITTYQALNETSYTEFEERELARLTESYLNLRKLWYDYDRFARAYEGIKVMVDLNGHPDNVKTQWSRIRVPLFDIIFESGITEGKFNWDSDHGKFQLKGAELSGCNISDIELVKCKLNGCVIENTHAWGCEFDRSRVRNTTLVNKNKVRKSILDSVRADRYNEINESIVHNNGEIINCKVNDSILRNVGIGKAAKLNENITIIETREFRPELIKGVEVPEKRDYRWLRNLTGSESPKGFANEYKDES